MKYLLQNLAQELFEPHEVNIPKGVLGPNRIQDGLQIVFGVAAAVAVLIIAISAFRMVISRGNPQDVQKARDAIIYAAVGLVITLSAFVIVTFVIGRI